MIGPMRLTAVQRLGLGSFALIAVGLVFACLLPGNGAAQTVAGRLGSSLDVVAYSPDGKTVAAGGDDGAVRLWDVRRLRLRGKPLGGGTGRVDSVAYSRDGRLLAVGYSVGIVRLWDPATEQELGAPLPIPSSRHGVWVAFTPAGSLVTDAGDVRIWSVRSRQQLGAVLGPGGGPVAVSRDGRMIAAGGDDGKVRLWDSRSRRQLGRPLEVGGHGDQVASVVFSPDGRRIAAAAGLTDVRLWDSRTHAELPRPFKPGATLVPDLAFSPDGRILAAADNRILFRDTVKQKAIAAPLTDDARRIAFSPDGRTIAAVGFDGGLRFWNLDRRREIGQPLVSYPAPFALATLSPDGHTIAASDSDGTVWLWDTAAPERLAQPLELTNDTDALAYCNSDAEPCGNDTVNSLRFSSDGSTVTADNDWPTASTWNVSTHQQIGETKFLDSSGDYNGAFVASSADDTVTAEALMPWLWGVAEVSWQRAGSAATAAPGAPIDDQINAIALSPDGQILAAAGYWLWVWDTVGKQQMEAKWAHPEDQTFFSFTSLAFTPTGQILAAAGSDGTLSFWNPWSQRQDGVAVKASQYESITSIAFSPDGSLFATASDDWTIRLWNSQNRTEIGPPLQDDGPVNSIAFSPDGSKLVSAGLAGVRLWDVTSHTSTPLPLPPPHPQP